MRFETNFAGEKVTYNYEVKRDLFGLVLRNVEIIRTTGTVRNVIQLEPNFSETKFKIRVVDDCLKDACGDICSIPEAIRKKFPMISAIYNGKGDIVLYASQIVNTNALSFDKYLANVDSEITFDEDLIFQIEYAARASVEFMKEYDKLRKSRYMQIIFRMRKIKEIEQELRLQRIGFVKTVIYGVRIASMLSGNGDTGDADVPSGFENADITALCGIDFDQWLDSVEIDGDGDFNADEKVDYLAEEGDASEISFTGHTPLSCNLCDCQMYSPVKDNKIGYTDKCTCGHTCGKHAWKN